MADILTNDKLEEKVIESLDYTFSFKVTNAREAGMQASDMLGSEQAFTEIPSKAQIDEFQVIAGKRMPDEKVMSVAYNKATMTLTVVVRVLTITGWAITVKALSLLCTTYLHQAGVDVELSKVGSVYGGSIGEEINYAIIKPVKKAVNNFVADSPDATENFIVNSIGGTIGKTMGELIKPLVVPLVAIVIIAIVAFFGYLIFMRKAVK
jgi:hypothetical protein